MYNNFIDWITKIEIKERLYLKHNIYVYMYPTGNLIILCIKNHQMCIVYDLISFVLFFLK